MAEYSVTEYAKHLGITRQAVLKKIKTGLPPGVEAKKIGNNYMITTELNLPSLEDLKNYMRQKELLMLKRTGNPNYDSFLSDAWLKCVKYYEKDEQIKEIKNHSIKQFQLILEFDNLISMDKFLNGIGKNLLQFVKIYLNDPDFNFTFEVKPK